MNKECPICQIATENVTRKGSEIQYDYCPKCEITFTSRRSPINVYFERREMEKETDA